MHTATKTFYWRALFYGVCGIACLYFLFYRFLLIQSPSPDIGGVENNIIYFIQRLLYGSSLYSNPDITPYAVAQYPPLYYHLVALTCKLFHIGPDDITAIYTCNRSVSLLLNLITCTVLFLFARKLRAGIGPAAVSAICYLVLSEQNACRPDSLSNLLWLISFFIATSAISTDIKSYRVPALVISAICAVLACFTKQSAVTLLFIIPSWLLVRRDLKSALTYSLVSLAAILVGLWIFSLTGNLHQLYQNTVLGISNGTSIISYWYNFIIHYYLRVGGTLLLCMLLVLVVYRKSDRKEMSSFFVWALAAQFILANLMALKYGSSYNYLNEWMMLLILNISIMWKHTQLQWQKLAFPFLLLAAVSIRIFSVLPSLENLLHPSQEQAELFTTEKKLSNLLLQKLQPGQCVFLDFYTPDSFLPLLLHQQAIAAQYDIVYYSLYPLQVFPYRNFRSSFSDGTVGYLVCRNSLLPFHDINLSHYVAESSMGDYVLYKWSSMK